MTDHAAHTGSRDDLTVDCSRCLRMRYSESACRRCVEVCPHGAITLENGLAITPDCCRGCLLCTAACPAGALEPDADFSDCLTKLSRVPEPVLGCRRTQLQAHATLSCLGGLSEEHLLALCQSLSGRLTLNLSRCADCPNTSMVRILQQRLDNLSGAGLHHGSCLIEAVASPGDLHFRDESVDRRSFFKSFGRAFFKSADIVLSARNGQAGRRSEYAEKRVPCRRELLNRAVEKLAEEMTARVQQHFDYDLSLAESCTTCQGCVAICPTGALTTVSSGDVPVFDSRRCTGCGLCREFCLDGAVRVVPWSEAHMKEDAGI